MGSALMCHKLQKELKKRTDELNRANERNALMQENVLTIDIDSMILIYSADDSASAADKKFGE